MKPKYNVFDEPPCKPGEKVLAWASAALLFAFVICSIFGITTV
jgi:hypothetical protein